MFFTLGKIVYIFSNLQELLLTGVLVSLSIIYHIAMFSIILIMYVLLVISCLVLSSGVASVYHVLTGPKTLMWLTAGWLLVKRYSVVLVLCLIVGMVLSLPVILGNWLQHHYTLNILKN